MKLDSSIKKQFYRVREICEMTGLSKPKIHQALTRGQLEGIKLEGTLLIPADSLKSYLDQAVPRTKDSGQGGSEGNAGRP